MNCQQTTICNLLDSNNRQFIIPIYQRKYYWQLNNCDQLLNDIFRLVDNPNGTHFLGSIVLVTMNASTNLMIIDGQQRITTISLLILAGIHAVKDGKLKVSNECFVEKAYSNYIDAKYVMADRKIKLQPLEEDCVAYDKIYRRDNDLIESSFITRNYKHFYDLLTQKADQYTFDQILNAADHLQVVTILLGAEDDAQLIFESINSTGVALNESDKIRNYILMSVPQDQAEKLYKDYWRKIELATNGKLDEFMRYYLAIKLKKTKPSSFSRLYADWKKFMQSKDCIEMLKDMLNFACYFQQVDRPDYASDLKNRILYKLSILNTLKSKMFYIFFLQFFDYANEKQLPEEEVFKVVDLVENYSARRTMVQSHSFTQTQVFCTLHNKVLNTIALQKRVNGSVLNSYSEIMAHHLLALSGDFKMPCNEEFCDAIKTINFYKRAPETRKFFLDRLENARGGEINNVCASLDNGTATIEHIMPQKLNKAWKDALGKDFKEVHNKYAHTLANLTITGYNSSLSDKPFLEKRDGSSKGTNKSLGYKDSKYRLTSQLVQYSKWTKEELEQRGDMMVKRLLTLYPFPEDKLQSVPTQFDEYSLADDFSVQKRSLIGFSFFTEDYEASDWKELLVKTLKIVLKNYSEQFDPLFNNQECYFTFDNGDKNLIQLESGRFFCFKKGARNCINILTKLFNALDIDANELIIKFKPLDDEPEVPVKPEAPVEPEDTKATEELKEPIAPQEEFNYSLADDFDPTFTDPVCYCLFGKNYDCKTWADIQRAVIKKLLELYPEKCAPLFERESLFFTKPNTSSKFIELAPNSFIRRDVCNPEKLRIMRIMFDHLNLDKSELRVRIKVKGKSAKN